MPGELCSDELEENVQSRYRKETFIFAIDTAVSSIRKHFTSHKEILADFALLDPERFADISTGDLPPNSFRNVAKNHGLDEWKLRAEYKSFIESYRKIKGAASRAITNDLTCSENANTKRDNFVTVLQLISKYNLQTAYQHLYGLYKILVTLPV